MAYHVRWDPRELRPYLGPPPPSTPAAVKRTYSGLNVARSAGPEAEGQPDSGGNTAALPAAIAVAAFVVATLVVLRVIRRTRQRREAINAARGQPDALERPRLWEVRLAGANGQGRWSDLMPVAAGYIQASDAVPHRTSVGSPLVYAAESSGGPSQRELHDSLEREDGSGMSVTVLVAMPAQPERGREKSPAHVAMGVALIDK